ncbi:MAG TPA: hypothetical protein ENJ11_04165 [Gammaproteobacteria bacterium]|nr:hypothetical protein [Gammaproteobacteria bacterium]
MPVKPVRLYSCFIAGFLCLLSTNSFAGDLLHMLQRMADADQQQNYRGTFILRKSDSISTLQVTHGVDEKGVWESLEALDGEPRKVLRHNNSVISIYPQRKLLTVRQSDGVQPLHQQLPSDFNQLERHYSIEQRPDGRIAGHDTLVVDVLPRDDLRYGYRYWAEKDTGILLRCDLVDSHGEVIEQMMFTSLEYLDRVPHDAFDLKQYQQYDQQVLNEPDLKVDFDLLQWRAKQLPDGFILKQGHLRYLDPAHNAVREKVPGTAEPDLLHLVYSDGLASVSVFIEKNLGEDKHLQGGVTMGALNAYGQPHDDFYVTAVGDVPMKTVKMIAGNMEYIH